MKEHEKFFANANRLQERLRDAFDEPEADIRVIFQPPKCAGLIEYRDSETNWIPVWKFDGLKNAAQTMQSIAEEKTDKELLDTVLEAQYG